MKVLLDEDTDERMLGLLVGHDVTHVRLRGWDGLLNGNLLSTVEQNDFEVLVTVDKNMPYQQTMKGRPFALIVLDIHPSNFLGQAACVPKLLELLPKVVAGDVHWIEGPHLKRR